MSIAVNRPDRALLPVALTLLVASGCERAVPPPAPPATVVTLPVHPDAVPGGAAQLRYPVEVAARYASVMSFRVPGKLIERRVRLGDAVHRGQVLALLDPADAEKQLAAARAALDAAEHRLVFARSQLARDQAQAKENLISATQLEQTQDAASAATAGREQAAAQLVVASHALAYNTLLAEHDGVITSENADTGQVVTAGQAVYGLAWSGDTDAWLDASAADVGQIAVGQAATISFPALPGQQLAAQVREIAPAADPATRTYRVKLTLLGNAADAVRLGMSGDVVLAPVAPAGDPRPDSPTFTIPSTALFHRGDSPAVWVLDPSSRLTLRPVTVTRHGASSSVVTGALKEGDVIVVAGVHAVYAGEPVKAVRPLFDEQGEVAGPALAQDSASGAPATLASSPSGAAR
jgi:RND family efflux transporter MFP subunit